MKASTFTLTALFSAAAYVSAMPQPDVVTIVDKDGNTWVGEDRSILAERGLDARCSCGTACYGWCSDCTPGQCQCAGDQGCWGYNGGPTICQKGPGQGEWYSSRESCYAAHPLIP